MVIIPVSSILRNVANLQKSSTNVKVYLFDNAAEDDKRYQNYTNFLGGAEFFKVHQEHDSVSIKAVEPVTMEEVRQSRGNGLHFEKNIVIASRTWTVMVVGEDDDYRPDYTFIVLGAGMIFVACICLVFWLYTNHRQTLQASSNEKAVIMLQNARQAAIKERELNDFVAHEVRLDRAKTQLYDSHCTISLFVAFAFAFAFRFLKTKVRNPLSAGKHVILK